MQSFDLPPLAMFAGGNASGKTTGGKARFERTGAPYVDAGDFLRFEAVKRNLDPEDRNVLSSIAKEWGRDQNNPAFLAQKAYESFENGFGSVISVRRVAEAEFLQKRGGMLIWVEAPVEERWKLANARARGATGEKTLEEFIAIENKEMFPKDPSDPFELNMNAVKKMADHVIHNVGFATEEAFSEHLAETFNLPAKIA